MKKILTILIVLISILFCDNVYALEDSFYKAETIDGVTYSKFNGIRQNRQAAIQRRTRDNLPVYCTEPFDLVKESYFYAGTALESEVYKKFSPEVVNRLKLLAYYGYGYKGHEDSKWYSITQLMMWRTIDPVNRFEWTDKLGGNIIYPFENEIKELNTMVANHGIKPALTDYTNLFSIGKDIMLADQRVNFNDYEVLDNNMKAKIIQNKLFISRSEPGDYFVKLRKLSNLYKEMPIFYFDDNHQDIMSVGNLNNPILTIRFKLIAGEITVKKVDSETGIVSQGEASLKGAVYDVLNEHGELAGKITIGDSLSASLGGLPLGKYILKETMSGNGYTLDKNEYKVELTHAKNVVNLELSNKVIKNEIVINKHYGSGTNFLAEKNITFEVYDSKGNLYQRITTDKNGKASIDLPFGKYTIKQVNTTEGYYKVSDMLVEVNEDALRQEYELVDLKIPDAHAESYKLPVYFYRKRYV